MRGMHGTFQDAAVGAPVVETAGGEDVPLEDGIAEYLKNRRIGLSSLFVARWREPGTALIAVLRQGFEYGSAGVIVAGGHGTRIPSQWEITLGLFGVRACIRLDVRGRVCSGPEGRARYFFWSSATLAATCCRIGLGSACSVTERTRSSATS